MSVDNLKDQRLIYRLIEQIRDEKRDKVEKSRNAYLSSQSELALQADNKPVIFNSLKTSSQATSSHTPSLENKNAPVEPEPNKGPKLK